ncbi:ER-derived vesicles protein erv46 [Mycoemilia scoparia]|uniref:ER-derived vesicles protein erv46 n=1 Tax=Mycoemilia scoparia TaxID=417184 RepID=A0A9W8A1F1_9FUNG|nr:ER-derived vesicles protein erv46 [Mycoemilia scoparia]
MAKRGSLASQFRTFDAYAKTMDDVSIRTLSGALITIISGIIMLFLTLNEYIDYKKIEMRPEIIVDKTMGEKLPINIDITFPNVPCVMLGLDVMDSIGSHEVNMFHHVTKTRISKDGQIIEVKKAGINDNSTKGLTVSLPKDYCGSCYGALPPENGCCNTCDDVHKAYLRTGWAFAEPEKMEQCQREGYLENIKAQRDEGCRLKGYVSVNKVAGNFHIMTGDTIKQNDVHFHALYDYMPQNFDFAHTINHLSFGASFKGQDNPLDGLKRDATAGTMFQYFVKVVSSEVRYLNGKVLKSNQYSVTEFERDTLSEAHEHGHNHKSPGFKVAYDISPMRVAYTEHKRTFGSFLTSVCAIVGGIFTISGIIDSFVFRTEQAIAKKRQIGKLE